MPARLPLLAAALLALSCAGAQTRPLPLSPVPPGAPDEEFQPTGEVQTRGESAAFDDWRVRGPRVNMTRRPDGTWAGTLVGRSVILTPGEGSLRGAGANLHFSRWNDGLAVLGFLDTLKIRIRIVPGAGALARDGKICRVEGGGGLLVDCRPKEAQIAGGILLRGAAARTDQPEMPQLGLALIAIAYLAVE